jgi:hypothetical protein
MLPGFRFLLCAIALSISILVFGLGAAALLRTAHEEFASNPSWRAAPEAPMIAQQSEPAEPVLAMLRIDPPHPIAQGSEPSPEASNIAAPDKEDNASALAPSETEVAPPPLPVASEPTFAPVVASDASSKTEEIKIAATDAAKLSDDDAPPTTIEAAEPGIMQPEAMMPDAAKLESAKAELASSDASNTKIATAEGAKAETALAAPPFASGAAMNPAATRIATLGGPAVMIEQAAPKKAADDKAERSAKAERRAEARARARRRAALRIRLAREQAAAQQAAQQSADPFGTTAIATPTLTPRRTR